MSRRKTDVPIFTRSVRVGPAGTAPVAEGSTRHIFLGPEILRHIIGPGSTDVGSTVREDRGERLRRRLHLPHASAEISVPTGQQMRKPIRGFGSGPGR